MLDLLVIFWAEFKQQPIFNQVSFLIPFVGLPTLIGVLFGWSTKARLRRVLEGYKAEVQVLTLERDALRASSFSHHLQEMGAQPTEYSIFDSEELFNRNRNEIASVCENLAADSLACYWSEAAKKDFEKAHYFAAIATAIDPLRILAQSIVKETESPKSTKRHLMDTMTQPMGFSDPHQVSAILLDSWTNEFAKGKFTDAEATARCMLIHAKAHGIIYSESGYNVLFALVKALIFRWDGKKPKQHVEEEIRGLIGLFDEIAARVVPNKNSMPRFVTFFHKATAICLLDGSVEALNLFEKESIIERMDKFARRPSSAYFATRHLYAQLLYGAHRPSEAELVVSSLERELSAEGELSPAHADTYRNWRKLASGRDYTAGWPLSFPNAAILSYRD